MKPNLSLLLLALGALTGTHAYAAQPPLKLNVLFIVADDLRTSLGKMIHLGLDPAGSRVPYQDAKSFDDCRNGTATALGKTGEGRNLTDDLTDTRKKRSQSGRTHSQIQRSGSTVLARCRICAPACPLRCSTQPVPMSLRK